MDQKKSSKIGTSVASMHGPESTQKTDLISRIGKMGMQLVAAAVSVVFIAGMLLLTDLGSAAVNTNGSEPDSGSTDVSPKVLAGFVRDVGISSESNSDGTSISNYYSGGYTTKLDCQLVSPTGSFPIYCDGGPIAIPDLPEGSYTVEIRGTSGLEIEPLSISLAVP